MMAFATTQEAYASLLRDHIAPALRLLGFKGSGASFTADQEGVLVNLGFERSRWGDRRETLIAVNLTVASIDDWARARTAFPFLPSRPATNEGYLEHLFGTGAWQDRVGSLMPGRRDRWWTLRTSTDLASLAEEIVSAIRDYGMPAIAKQVKERAPPHVTLHDAD